MPERDQNADFDDQPTIPPRIADRDTDTDGRTLLPQSVGKSKSPDPPSLSIPQIENYEILDELGRGGMGVVYKARDTKLDRIVALKMILGGKFASQEEIERFRIEGEAAARLDHPGIVPIYETEEFDGNHFFSMKFVEGQSLLDRLEEFKSDRRAACATVAKIADAVQHAHQRAVLHRDLKPANVLVDESGQPAITDFGLAKRIDGESELTQTGLVMGTPGFMSPEQAAGRKDITTAADVFSLGAILFWLITGEPPFKGETGIQAVMSTIEGDVPSIKSFAPEASYDLDLICQKAMHKDPLQRYSSAAAMAEDLRAWLDGESLSVRRATAMSVASVWVRKNLRTVLAACLTGLLCGLLVGGLIAVSDLKNAVELEHQVQQLGGQSSKTWVNNFMFLRGMSKNWQLLQYLVVPAIAVCAFLCVSYVRPKTREASIVSAVACGIVASASTFLITGGMGVMNSYSVEKGSNDIELLSAAVWLDSEPERKWAQRALTQRYPGLTDLDTDKRASIIRQKIIHEQTSGLTPGIWMGVCITILFTGLPLTLTCILSGALWRQGVRGWEWFGCTWERAAYLLVFFLALSFWLRPVRPSAWLMLITLALLLFGLFLAVRMSHWFWRVAMIPVPFILMNLVNGDIASMTNSTWRAGTATNVTELKQQLTQSDRRLEMNDRFFQRYSTGIGWLHLGTEEKYQLHCRALINSFENAFRPEIADQLAKIILLRPSLNQSEDFELACELSELASGLKSSENSRWFYSTRALAEVRRGNADEAMEWNLRCRDGVNSNDNSISNGYMIALSHLVDALAWLELEKSGKAKTSLETALKVSDEARSKSMEDGHDDQWPNWLVIQILEKQVVAGLEN